MDRVLAPHDSPPRPIPWWRIAIVGGLLAALLAVITTAVVGPDDLSKDQSLRLDALKIVLTGIAGYGAAVTLWLSLRRQSHHEQQVYVQHVLEERKREAEARVQRDRHSLDLYSAAATQLASDSAAVRLAGLYSFDRLGQQDVAFRQTVTDVFCAYLRMVPSSTDARELEVRRSAQTLLMRHARQEGEDDPAVWDVAIDLSRAYLTDLDARRAVFGRVDFKNAHFRGETLFDHVTFRYDVYFDFAEFDGRSEFRRVRFLGRGSWAYTSWDGAEAAFVGSRFQGAVTNFAGARFRVQTSVFRGVKFLSSNSTNFSHVTFSGLATFKKARFESRVTSFNRICFEKIGVFAEASCTSDRVISGSALPPCFDAMAFKVEPTAPESDPDDNRELAADSAEAGV